MKRRPFTILILSDTTAHVRRLRITPLALKCCAAIAILFFLTFGFLVSHYARFQAERDELQRLRAEAQQRTVLVTRMETLKKEIGRLQVFDDRVRDLAGLSKAPPQELSVAVGGGVDRSEEAAKSEIEAQRDTLLDKMLEDLQRIEREIALREHSLQSLTEYLERQKDKLAATPSIWPVKGFLSSGFGPRKSPFTGRRQRHSGIDISAHAGTPIVAPADGVVTFSGRLAGYGNAVVINHGFGLKTFYGHNKRNRVKVGTRVKRGDVIADVGSTGYSTGPHVHYEVLVNNTPVNPTRYIIDYQESKARRVLKR